MIVCYLSCCTIANGDVSNTAPSYAINSSKYAIKSRGDRTPPCLTPIITLKLFDRHPCRLAHAKLTSKASTRQTLYIDVENKNVSIGCEAKSKRQAGIHITHYSPLSKRLTVSANTVVQCA